MKILCLHGNGMSGAFFEMQTLAFRKLLGDEHEYVFLDGQLESDCVLGRLLFTRYPVPSLTCW
jgi:hypothetical protein